MIFDLHFVIFHIQYVKHVLKNTLILKKKTNVPNVKNLSKLFISFQEKYVKIMILMKCV